MPGGTERAISPMRSSAMGPGPLGIADTSPIADAPSSMARRGVHFGAGSSLDSTLGSAFSFQLFALARKRGIHSSLFS